ncbi:hypothetical protein M378DRAFT_89255 [Amanita muscaria Koide BX008]|uniref:Uncharacterized protein n=1 Tax=Amanita muscaria (strain Koide BX008) TaxID=946122 RepID=A0A0C2SR49_AMAMK|nr:hypothetical protein M378DRAFT_89255 [Amanita muscaria Koide BX008]
MAGRQRGKFRTGKRLRRETSTRFHRLPRKWRVRMQAYRWIVDCRDANKRQRKEKLPNEMSMYRCHTIFNSVSVSSFCAVAYHVVMCRLSHVSKIKGQISSTYRCPHQKVM